MLIYVDTQARSHWGSQAVGFQISWETHFGFLAWFDVFRFPKIGDG